jgi:hypothetical protein
VIFAIVTLGPKAIPKADAQNALSRQAKRFSWRHADKSINATTAMNSIIPTLATIPSPVTAERPEGNSSLLERQKLIVL